MSISRPEVIDKTAWPRGAWDLEPDELYWTDERTGLKCAIFRNRYLGYLHGYVMVPNGHRYHDVPAKDIPAARAEASFVSMCGCHTSIGFGCGRLGYWIPAKEGIDNEPGSRYIGIDERRRMCAELAAELSGNPPGGG